MKNLSQSILSKAAFLLLFLLMGQSSKAQLCVPSYPIVNNSTCNVRYSYKIFDGSTCATTQWGSGNIAPLGTLTISGITPMVEDIELILTFSSSISTLPLNFGSGAPLGGGSWTCYNSGAPATQTDFGPGLACNFTFAGFYNVVVGCTQTDIW